MSNQAITWAYGQDITSGAKFVLVALADMADEAHSCFPGQAKLASMTGQGVRTVRRQLAELEEGGYITRERRFDATGHRTSDRYVLAVTSGQIGQRPNQPVAISTTGQSGHRSDEPQANDDNPSGQSGQVTQRDPSTTPQPPASGGPKIGHCKRHTKFRRGCDPCADALAESKAKPPWCGECDEHTRQRLDPEEHIPLGRCPSCHPLTRTDHRRTA